IDEQALGGNTLASGQVATVIAARGADGHLRALTVSVTSSIQDERSLVISGVVEAVDDEQVQIGGQTFDITQDTLLTLKLLSGKRVEVTVNTVGDRTVATAVAPLPEETADILTLEGTIENEVQVTDEVNRWLIAGQSFVVTPATNFDAQGGALAKGAGVRVEARRENGDIVAKRVVVLAAEKPSKEITVEGVFEGALADGKWEVSGITIDAPEGEQPPPVGSNVRITGKGKEAEIAATDVFTLQRPDSPEDQVKMSGLILRADETALQVGIANVAVTEATLFSQESVEGARAIIWGRLNREGAVEAVYIDVLDSRPLRAPSFPASETR
ncbi:MAG: DUF5666 domain-containing protein, partial [Dehalococcoidia bacterium]